HRRRRMPQPESRFISFERCFNFRDLGGYRTEDGGTVHRGRLFRSMTPQFMTEADVKRAREDLGIRRVLDLREWRDRPEIVGGPLGDPPNERFVVTFAEFARFPEVRDLPIEQVLTKHLDYSKAGIVQAIELLAAETEGATLFHCQTGKDRTGVLAAILLRLLGVSVEDAVAD